MKDIEKEEARVRELEQKENWLYADYRTAESRRGTANAKPAFNDYLFAHMDALVARCSLDARKRSEKEGN